MRTDTAAGRREAWGSHARAGLAKANGLSGRRHRGWERVAAYRYEVLSTCMKCELYLSS